MEKSKIKAKYIFDDDFEPEYVTGAFGNVLPSGELVVNFYLERLPIPYETIQEIKDDGKIADELTVSNPNPSDFKLRRTIKSGVIMNQSTTLSVYRWLKAKLLDLGVDPNEL